MLIQAVLPLLGHAAVLRVLRWLAIPFVVLFAVMAVLTTSKVNLHVPAHGASWGALTIFLALVISAGGLGWTENGNDYSRYLPRDDRQEADRAGRRARRRHPLRAAGDPRRRDRDRSAERHDVERPGRPASPAGSSGRT